MIKLKNVKSNDVGGSKTTNDESMTNKRSTTKGESTTNDESITAKEDASISPY